LTFSLISSLLSSVIPNHSLPIALQYHVVKLNWFAIGKLCENRGLDSRIRNEHPMLSYRIDDKKRSYYYNHPEEWCCVFFRVFLPAHFFAIAP